MKKIRLSELEKGMYVCGVEKRGMSPVFLVNDILVRSDDDLTRMSARGYAHVYISLNEKEAAQHAANDGDGAAGAPFYPGTETLTAADEGAQGAESGKDNPSDPYREFKKELAEAEDIRHDAEQVVRDFLQNARSGQSIDSDRVLETVGRMVDSVIRNQDALTSLARLKSFDDYTFAHSVNVCILSLAVGRHLGLEKDDLDQLGLGAILHDIGKMLVPGDLLNKPGRLSEGEFTVMKKHTELGKDVLAGMKCVKEPALRVVLEHHERFDGSGYHMRLSGSGIHLYARITGIADVYDAMTSNRVYQKGMRPEDALKRLYHSRGSLFDPELVERLIKCLGVYPIGTCVELNTGEAAIVNMINHSHPLKPRVLLIADREGLPFPVPLETDLKEDAGRWIVGSKKPEEFAFHIPALCAN
ncbi:MAG: HD-GYP domain-containing protein [Candidatus Methylomirabilis sp.]|nr:HD-GYP domain-containing protein [Deltaproteobacteria bacterium]